jgi:hypothetical protein
MPAIPSQQDPLQDIWRVEELTPDVRRRLAEADPVYLPRSRRRIEGPAHVSPAPHRERPSAA